VSRGAGLQLRLVEWVPWTVEQLLADSARLARLRERARGAGRPNAARDIAEHVARELRTGKHA